MHRFQRIGGLLAFILISLLAAATRAQTPFIYATAGGGILAYSADGSSAEVTYVGGQPNALAFNSSGDLFIWLDDVGIVGEYVPNAPFKLFSGPLYAADGLAFDSLGSLYVAQTYGLNNIIKISPGGATSTFASLPTRPVGIAFDSSGNLYTADQDNGTIDKITPGGTVSTFITGLASPTGIAFNASGDLYIANDGSFNGTVQEFSPSGGLISTVASGLQAPYSLAFDNSGNLFIGTLGAFEADGSIEEITSQGATSILASDIPSVWALAITPADALLTKIVPEPATADVLACVGAIGFLLGRPRQRAR